MSKSSDKVVDLIESYLSDDSLVWHKPYLSAAQANAVSKKEYRGMNAFLTALVAGMEGYASPYWATFKQIKELGGVLKDAKGKGVPIIFYKELESENEADNERKRCVMRHSFVFNFDLVEGVELPALANNENEGFSVDLIAENTVTGYIEREQVRVVEGVMPLYAPAIDTVKMQNLKSFCSQDEYYSTFFHELAHSTGHKNRLARFDKEQEILKSREDYSKEELVAEVTAALLCHESEVDSQASIKNSAAYIRGWSKFIKDNSAAFVSAVNQAYKARDFILGKTA